MTTNNKSQIQKKHVVVIILQVTRPVFTDHKRSAREGKAFGRVCYYIHGRTWQAGKRPSIWWEGSGGKEIPSERAGQEGLRRKVALETGG